MKTKILPGPILFLGIVLLAFIQPAWGFKDEKHEWGSRDALTPESVPGETSVTGSSSQTYVKGDTWRTTMSRHALILEAGHSAEVEIEALVANPSGTGLKIWVAPLEALATCAVLPTSVDAVATSLGTMSSGKKTIGITSPSSGSFAVNKGSGAGTVTFTSSGKTICIVLAATTVGTTQSGSCAYSIRTQVKNNSSVVDGTVLVTFMDGEKRYMTQRFTVGSTYKQLPVPYKLGFDFGNWYSSPSFTSSSLVTAETKVSSLIKTLYAYWNPRSYTLVYDYDGGVKGAHNPSYAMYGTPFYVSAPTRSGWTFAGWKVTKGLNPDTAKWGTTAEPSMPISSSSDLCANGAAGDVYFLNLNVSAVTLTASWTKNAVAPGAPTGVSATTDRTDGIRVSWTGGAGATSHNVWRGTTTSRSNARKIKTGATSPYPDTSSDLEAETTYYYWIEAVNSADSTFSTSYGAGKKAKAAEIPGAPSAPTSLNATTTLTNGIRVSWTGGSGATSHNVWRGTTRTRGDARRIKIGATSPYLDKDSELVAGKSYYYWIEATNAVGSTFSTSYVTGEKAMATWKYTISNGTATVTGGSANGAVTIPSMLGGCPVTRIGSEALRGLTGMTAVTIPDSVTNIGYAAFRDCTGLTTMTIPESVVNIEQAAFIYCDGLTNVSIGRGVTNIGECAFYMCTNLTAMAIPDNVVNIDSMAFSRCSNLTSVAIGNGVKSIGAWAFSRSGLLDATVSAGVTNIGVGAWGACDKLKTIDVVAQNKCYASEDGVLFSKKKDLLVSYPGGRKGAYAIPAGVTEIGERAFSECNGLTAVTIPDSVKVIGENVCEDCNNLVRVSMGNNVKTIGCRAFANCVELANLSLPSSVTNIGYGAFFQCQNLTEMAIPFGVSDIGLDTFGICVDLENVLIPNSVTNIGAYAFSRCYTLTEVAIPDSVERIQYYAFSYCSNLTSVTIGNGVTNIGESAFFDCPGLATLFVPVSRKGTDMLAKARVPSTCSIVYYSSGTISTQKVMFNANGGTCATATQTYLVGRGYTNLPTATRTDHTFNGWYTATNGGTRITSGTTVTTNAERTLFAQWTANVSAPGAPTGLGATTTLTNGIQVSWTGGSGATSHNVWRGTTTARSNANRIKIGATTPYPDTDSALISGTSYYYWIEATNSAGSTFSASYAMGKKAAPTPITYGIGYALDGGTKGTYAPTNATYGTAFRVSAPTKNGCTFAGWSVSSGLDSSSAKWGTGATPSTAISSSGTVCANGMNDVYFLNLRSTAGSVTLKANWTTNAVPAPANDRYAAAQNLGKKAAGAISLSNEGATWEPGEPPIYGSARRTNSVWWVWTAPAQGVARFDTVGSEFDTVMTVFTNGTPGDITALKAVKSDNDGGGNGTSRVWFNTAAQGTYWIAVAGRGAQDSGAIALNWQQCVKVLFKGNGATSGSMGIRTNAYKTATALPACGFERTGYVCDGWATSATGTVAYALDAAPAFTKTTTLYAHWAKVVPRPANDDYAAAESLGKKAAGAIARSNAGATWEPGEPPIYGSARRTNSVWWVWTAPAQGVARFDTVGSGFDTVMTVFTNGTPDDIATLKAVKSDNDGGGNGTSRVWFNTTAQGRYWIAVAGRGAQDSGAIALNWQQCVKVLFKGNGATSGSMGIRTNAYKTATALPACGFERTGYVCDGWATSATGTVAYAPGASPAFTKTTTLYAHWAKVVPLPANDDYASAESIGKKAAGAIARSNAGATWEPGEPPIYGSARRTNSVWWVWTAPAQGVARFDTVGSEFDTVMTVFTNGTPDDISMLKAVKSDNDGGGNGTSRVWFNTAAQGTYWIAVAGRGAQDSGAIALNWQQCVKVAFKGNKATSGSMGILTNAYKTATPLPACVFERTGYVCDGWATSATGTVAYVPGAAPAFTKNTTLYAHWVEETAKPNLKSYKPKAWPAAIFLTEAEDGTNVMESVSTGETAYLRFCYGNFGKAAMGTHRVSAVVTNAGGSAVAGGSWTNGGLKIKGILPGILEVRVEEAGTYAAVVTLDPDGAIEESYESDNVFRLEFAAESPVMLTLGANERSFTEDAATSKELAVTANVSWTATSSATWLTVKTAGGSGNGKIVYNVAANTGTASRTAKITVTGGGITRAFTVTQSGKASPLTLAATNRTFTASAASGKELGVTASVSWTAKSLASWLTVKTASGSGNGKIVYNVAANTGTASRTAKITVTGGGTTRTFTVTQAGKSDGGGTTATLTLGASERSFTADAANSKELAVTANVSWTATSSASWLTVKTGSGSGNGKIVYNVAANTGAARAGTITVSGGGLARAFTVTQSGKDKAAKSAGAKPQVWVTTSDGSDGAAVADGDEATGWSPSGAEGAWVALTFEEERTVEAVEVVGELLPEGMRALASTDGDDWSEEGGEGVSYLWVLLPGEGAVPVVREIVTEP